MYDGLNVGKRNVTLNLKQPEAVALVQPARRRVGRRGRRELRAACDEGLRPRLRHARRDQARPRDDERVPQRPDRSAQGLPRLRRPGLRARGLQRAHRLARPRAGRPVRHDHRLARAALRRDRARGRPALPPAHRHAACTSTSSQVECGDLVAGAVAARLRGRRRDPPARRQPPRATQSCTARSRAPTKATSATAGSRSRAGPTTSGTRSRAHRARRSDARDVRGAQGARTRSRRSSRPGRAPDPRSRSPSSCRPPGIEAVPVQGLRRPARRPAARAPRPLRAAHHPFLGARPLRAQRLPPRAMPGGYDQRRADARPGQRLGARATCSGSTDARDRGSCSARRAPTNDSARVRPPTTITARTFDQSIPADLDWVAATHADVRVARRLDRRRDRRRPIGRRVCGARSTATPSSSCSSRRTAAPAPAPRCSKRSSTTRATKAGTTLAHHDATTTPTRSAVPARRLGLGRLPPRRGHEARNAQARDSPRPATTASRSATRSSSSTR